MTRKIPLALGITLVGLFSFFRYTTSVQGSEESSKTLRVGLQSDKGALESSLPYAPILSEKGLPSSVDLSDEMPPVYDQGDRASSVGFTLGYYLKSYTERQKKLNSPSKSMTDANSNAYFADQKNTFSPRYIYNATNQGKDQGGSLLDGLILLKSNGILPWEDLPYRTDDYRSRNFLTNRKSLEYRIREFFRMKTSEINQIKAQLHNGNPIPVGLLFYKNYLEPESPYVFDKPDGEFLGVQSVLLVGFDDSKKSFLALNSWGEDWGEDGKFWISYENFQRTAQSAYLVVDPPELPRIQDIKTSYPGEIIASQGNYKNKIRLSWKIVNGAIGYEIYRKRTVASEFKLVGLALDNQFEDEGIHPNLAYQYKIASVFPDNSSDLSPGIVEGFASSSTDKYSGEVLTGLNVSEGEYADKILLRWNPIPGKQSYHVYKFNPYSQAYRKIATTKSPEYTDRKAKRNGELEFYRVTVAGPYLESRLTPASIGYTSNRSAVLPPPAIVQASKGEYTNKIRLDWEPISGADSYIIYKSEADKTNWKKIASTRNSYFEDTSGEEKEAFYSIQTLSKLGIPSKGSFPILGILATGRERGDSLPPPENIEFTRNEKNPKSTELTWKPVPNSTGYVIYKRKVGGSWKQIAKTTSNRYSDNSPSFEFNLYAISSVNSEDEVGKKSQEYAFGFMEKVQDKAKDRSFGQDSPVEKFKGPWTTMYWDGKASVTQLQLFIDSKTRENESIQIKLNNIMIYQGDYIQETKILDPQGRFQISLSESETSLQMDIFDKNIFPEKTNLSFLRE